MRLTTLLGLGIGTALLGKRVQQIAEREGRPLSDVLADLPARIAQDMRSFPEDLRMAADEGRWPRLEDPRQVRPRRVAFDGVHHRQGVHGVADGAHHHESDPIERSIPDQRHRRTPSSVNSS